MVALEPLVAVEGKPPATASGLLGCVMLHVTGVDDELQWFTYKMGFFSKETTIEWNKDTMHIVLAADVAEPLIRYGHARLMTASEVWVYNTKVEKETKS